MKDLNDVTNQFDELLKKYRQEMQTLMKSGENYIGEEKEIFLKATRNMANNLTKGSEEGIIASYQKAMDQINNLKK